MGLFYLPEVVALVQTFLPYADFVVVASVLDRQRLGKQRVETLQILKALTGLSLGWVNHPAVKMWRGYEPLLTQYGVAMCDEWTGRGYQDTCKNKILELGEVAVACKVPDLRQERDAQGRVPSWLGNREFHISHQSNLIRKAPEYYSKYFIGVPNDLPYVWPSVTPLPAAEDGAPMSKSNSTQQNRVVI